jgi:hypothetical protein
MFVFCFSVHLKIHIPEIKHSHKHTKTKYIHIYHPKVVHSDHSSVQFLHSRRDPNIGLVNGGYPQPLVNLNEHQPELRITEEEFRKWRAEQVRKALDERKRVQEERENNADVDDAVDDENYEAKDDEIRDESYNDDLYRKHKANKANSSGRREPSKHRNHNYNQDFEASNSDKHYTNYSTRSSSRRKPPPVSYNRSRKNTQRPYGSPQQPDAQASNIQLQYQNVDPTVLDPTFYSTIPDQTPASTDQQDDIYSGLLSKKFNKKIVDKSRLLADINYNRKTQTKLFASRRRDE